MIDNLASLADRWTVVFHQGEAIEAQLTSRVARWVWSIAPVYALQPFYFERNNQKRGEVLETESLEEAFVFQYGLDARDKPLIQYEYGVGEDPIRSQFYQYHEQAVEVLHFKTVHDEDENGLMLQQLERLNQSAQKPSQYLMMTSDWHIQHSTRFIETYTYENDLLVRVDKNEAQLLKGVMVSALTGEEQFFYTPDQHLKRIEEYLQYELSDELRETRTVKYVRNAS